MVVDWDDAYANAAHIPGGDAYPARWARSAAAFRDALPPGRLRAGLPYGGHPRQRLDLFLPEGAPRGLAVFVHGGYWRAFDRSDWSHLAAGLTARGWSVAVPSYVLAPEARISAITGMIAEAIAAAAAEVPGPLVLAGHSAGGHLVTRQLCAGAPLPPSVADRIARVVSISGLHDLRPLLHTAINADLHLDPDEARAESPALAEPVAGTRLHAWVGADERPEFRRQAALIANIWTGLGAETSLTIEPGRHHFDVIDALARPDSALVAALVGDGAAAPEPGRTWQ